MQENKQLKQLVDGKWEDAEELQFFYPQWIEKIPIKFVREIAENWYFRHGEWLEWKIEEWRDKYGKRL